MPVVTTVERRMQRLWTFDLAGVVDDVFGLVRKLSRHTLQREGREMRCLFLCKGFVGFDRTGHGWKKQDRQTEGDDFHISNGAMVCRCECVVRSPYPESQNEKPDMVFRFFAKSSATPVLQRCQDEARYPSRCDGPIASDRGLRPDQTPQWATAF